MLVFFLAASLIPELGCIIPVVPFDYVMEGTTQKGLAYKPSHRSQYIWHGEDDGQSETPSPQTNTLAQTLNVGDNVNFSGEKLLVNKYTVNADGSFSVGLQSQGEFSDDSDPLDNETISTDAGSWTIQQSNIHDGSTVYDLTAQHSVLDTLAEGDTISSGENNYTVSALSRSDDGTISLSLS